MTSPKVESTVCQFKCLWTLQKTQKRKNWRDGTLHFHKFNHRALLYDEDVRLVVPTRCHLILADVEDDLFLPNSDIGVGDELEFEAALVTIEEGFYLTCSVLTMQKRG
jgi:Protein of unknown function (DUF2439)